MMQLEEVLKMLLPDFNIRRIAPKRRFVGKPFFKRGTLFRNAVDDATGWRPDDGREITDGLIAAKAPEATRKQAIDIQAAILAALRKRNGEMVVGEGNPAKWRFASVE
jgi:hypothetical protein